MKFNLDLSFIPDGWFLKKLEHVYTLALTEEEYKDRKEVNWLCVLEQTSTGKQVQAVSDNPLDAFYDSFDETVGG